MPPPSFQVGAGNSERGPGTSNAPIGRARFQPSASSHVWVETSSTDQAVTANEIDKTYFSDSSFTTVIGESDLPCTGGKRVTGKSSTWFATFTYSCHGGTQTLQCYELAPTGTDLLPISCPESVYDIIVD